MTSVDRYAVIGDPVAHSRSPEIHSAFAEQTGDPIEYTRIRANTSEFDGVARRFFASGGKGLNVTLPHKRAAYALADNKTVRAKRAQVANILMQREDMIIGDNTDGAGLVVDLKRNIDLVLNGARIIILGAGGAASGILGPILDEDPALVHIVNRNLERAHRLADLFLRVEVSDYESMPEEPFDLVVNATSAGHEGRCPTFKPEVIGQNTIGYDLTYGAPGQPFCKTVEELGGRVFDGTGMLIEQAAESFFIWRGVRPRTDALIKLFRGSDIVA